MNVGQSRALRMCSDFAPRAIRAPSRCPDFATRCSGALLAVFMGMAGVAQRNHVELRIVSRLTSEPLVVNLQVPHRPTILTSPIVPFEHLQTEFFVSIRVKLDSGRLWADAVHEAFPLTCSRNACLSCPGRNLKNLVMDCSRISGLLFSKLAPARKSAQIISRQ